MASESIIGAALHSMGNKWKGGIAGAIILPVLVNKKAGVKNPLALAFCALLGGTIGSSIEYKLTEPKL